MKTKKTYPGLLRVMIFRRIFLDCLMLKAVVYFYCFGIGPSTVIIRITSEVLNTKCINPDKKQTKGFIAFIDI